MKYVLKATPVEANQWRQNGDHPLDYSEMSIGKDNVMVITEGKFVRRFRDPNVSGKHKCEKCGHEMDRHGWIESNSGGIAVCPGDWIVTNHCGLVQTYSDETFHMLYENYESAPMKLVSEYAQVGFELKEENIYDR